MKLYAKTQDFTFLVLVMPVNTHELKLVAQRIKVLNNTLLYRLLTHTIKRSEFKI